MNFIGHYARGGRDDELVPRLSVHCLRDSVRKKREVGQISRIK